MKKTMARKTTKKQDPEAFSHTQLLRLTDSAYEAIRAYRASELQRTGKRPSISVAINTMLIMVGVLQAQERQS